MQLDLLDAFRSLDEPMPGDPGFPLFTTHPIAELEGVLIGKSSGGGACLLVSAAPDDTSRPPYDLDLLRVDWNRPVKYIHGGHQTENRFTIIRCKGNDLEQIELFLYIFVSLLSRLEQPFKSQSVMESVNRCIQLFQRSQLPSSKSVLGVWSELLLICLSGDPNFFARAWHSSANEKYDFAFGSSLIEVKCTTGPTRSHHFSAAQLIPPSGAKCWVASFRTSILTNGTTVKDLVEKATNREGISLENAERILDITISALGKDWASGRAQSFDRKEAVASLKFFRSQDVPSVGTVPAGVSAVQFTSELEFANPAPDDDFLDPLLSQLCGRQHGH
jgi:hypothetical protein